MPGQPQPLVTQQSITGIPGILVTACKLWQWYPCTVMEDARAAVLEHSAAITKQCCSHYSQKEATRDRSMAKSKDPPKNSGLLLLSSITDRRICSSLAKRERRREARRARQMSQEQAKKQKHQLTPTRKPSGSILPAIPSPVLSSAIHTTFCPLLGINNSCQWPFC